MDLTVALVQGAGDGRAAPPASTEAWPDDDAGVLGEQTEMVERLIISPTTGKFRPRLPSLGANSVVRPGLVIGTVGDVAVESPFAGYLMGYLAISGERVEHGQALAWLRPSDERFEDRLIEAVS